jgi:hypothetical protein
MTIPRSIVIESDFSEPDWDVQLALKLWDQVSSTASSFSSSSTFKSSDLSGYVALLTRGWDAKRDLPSPPPSTAADALRNWTDEQKDVLLASDQNPAGQRLLDLLRQQDELWRRKYDDVVGGRGSGSTTQLTWEQFVWAMEVVHSRAFCGDFGVGGNQQLPVAVTIASPFVAALAGYIYYVTLHGQQDLVLVGLAALAGLPALTNLVSSSSQSSNVAVLLPLIDSANHREDADSVIEYSLLQNAFTLRGGAACIVDEPGAGGKKQLYISYGRKKDAECLLNYGFLPGSSLSLADDSTSRRRKLAEFYLARNAR